MNESHQAYVTLLTEELAITNFWSYLSVIAPFIGVLVVFSFAYAFIKVKIQVRNRYRI